MGRVKGLNRSHRGDLLRFNRRAHFIRVRLLRRNFRRLRCDEQFGFLAFHRLVVFHDGLGDDGFGNAHMRRVLRARVCAEKRGKALRLHVRQRLNPLSKRGGGVGGTYSDDIQARVELVAVSLQRVFQVVIQTVEVVNEHLLRRRHNSHGEKRARAVECAGGGGGTCSVLRLHS